jgi:hypothetical protein
MKPPTTALTCAQICALAFLSVFTISTLAQETKKENVNVTGDWVFQVETDAGGGSPTFTFKQDGEKLEGTYKGAFGEAKLTGTVKASAITFSFTAEAQGNKVTCTYEGTVEDASSMKGKVKLGDLGEGTFTGKRSK